MVTRFGRSASGRVTRSVADPHTSLAQSRPFRSGARPIPVRKAPARTKKRRFGDGTGFAFGGRAEGTDTTHGGDLVLVLTRKVGEAVVISGGIVIRVLSAGGRIRLGVEAPDDAVVLREEVAARLNFLPEVASKPECATTARS